MALIAHSAVLWTDGPLCCYITLDFCFVNKWQRGQKGSSTAHGDHQTAPNMARKGRSRAAAYPPNWSETPHPPPRHLPPPTYHPQLSRLSSINSFHAGQQPEILHIPPPSYLKFISNKWSIKGNVCTVTATAPSWGDSDHNHPLVSIMNTTLGGHTLEFFELYLNRISECVYIIHRP